MRTLLAVIIVLAFTPLTTRAFFGGFALVSRSLVAVAIILIITIAMVARGVVVSMSVFAVLVLGGCYKLLE